MGKVNGWSHFTQISVKTMQTGKKDIPTVTGQDGINPAGK